MDLYFPAPPKPEQYLHIYVDVMATRVAWNALPNQALFFPDPTACVEPRNEGFQGYSRNDENIPLELIRIATNRCPFLGAQVELMFKELGIYEANSPQSTKR